MCHHLSPVTDLEKSAIQPKNPNPMQSKSRLIHVETQYSANGIMSLRLVWARVEERRMAHKTLRGIIYVDIPTTQEYIEIIENPTAEDFAIVNMIEESQMQ